MPDPYEAEGAFSDLVCPTDIINSTLSIWTVFSVSAMSAIISDAT
jgi:hypothetical protein